MPDEHNIISFKEAKAKGLKRFFTGIPCKHGHNAERYVINRECVVCRYEKTKHLQKTDPEYFNKRRRTPEFRDRKNTLRRENWCDGDRRYLKDYRARNKLKLKKWLETYYKANKERFYANVAKRRARKVGAGGQYTAGDIQFILKKQKYRCAYCKINLRKKKYHIDHIMPLALGGSNNRSNVQIACAKCNLSKHAKHPNDFAREMGFLI